MLVRNHDARRAAAHSSQFLWDTISRHRNILIAFPLLFLAMAAVYVSLRGSSYTAASRLGIDNRILQFNPQEAILPTSSISSPLLQSQVAILQSDKIARDAMKALGLINDPEFLPKSSASETEATKEARVLEKLQNKIHASRIGESYLIDVRATSADPIKAAKITNAVVKAYLDDQANSNADVANSVSPWLRSKVASLGTTARVVSEATPPLKRDQLPDAFILALGLASGLVFGFTLAFALDWFDNRMKTREAVERVCGAECFGMLPCMKKPPWYSKLTSGKRSPRASRQTLEEDPSLLWAINNPQSHFVHALRNTRAAILEQKETNPVIGVTSPASGEGKSVVAANLARLMAVANQKVLLVDADPYRASLTASLSPGAVAGLAQALDGHNLPDILWTCDKTGLEFLPNPGGENGSRPGYLLSATSEKFFNELAREYDWIFLDLPPLDPVPDVREAQPLVHGMLLVLEWNKTTAEQLATILDSAGPVRSKLIGVLFNKAGEKMFRRRRSPSHKSKPSIHTKGKFNPTSRGHGMDAPGDRAGQTSPPAPHIEWTAGE
jgi:polysaccharide biosynthesis transport protein